MKELAQQIIEISNQVDELNKYKQERNVKTWFVQNQREQSKTDRAK